MKNKSKSDKIPKTLLGRLDYRVQSINDNKFFIGIIVLVLNVFSKYVEIKLTKTQEAYFKNNLIRQLFIFAVLWSGTRDIYISILMTAAFVILADYLFNEESKFCLIPQHWSDKMKQAIDADGDGKLSDQEIEHAIHILQQAKQDQINNNQDAQYVSFINKLP
jgi:hypothetical protein|tara:strand:+ start:438 stop:926 length:489 start_codon:yes stop_codon:yes gene_type:complete